MRTLVPDFVFTRTPAVTVGFLRTQRIRALLCDIDNTLSPYEEAVPNGEIIAWVREMTAAGIALALVSNNERSRVETYNAPLGLPAYFDAHKPSRRAYRQAMEALGIPDGECAVLGDQLLTDCLAARRLGLRCLIVPPIRDKKTLFFRFKRTLEIPFMNAYFRRNKTYADKT